MVLEPVFTAENGVWTELFQSDPRQKCSESTKDSSAFFLDGLENPSPIPPFPAMNTGSYSTHNSQRTGIPSLICGGQKENFSDVLQPFGNMRGIEVAGQSSGTEKRKGVTSSGMIILLIVGVRLSGTIALKRIRRAPYAWHTGPFFFHVSRIRPLAESGCVAVSAPPMGMNFFFTKKWVGGRSSTKGVSARQGLTSNTP